MEIDFLKYPIDDKHLDSFWYYGETIATISDQDVTIDIVASGEIKVMFEVDGSWYTNNQAVEEAIRRNLDDDDLLTLSEHDGWGNNNWFETVGLDDTGCDGVSYDYEEAINDGIRELIERNYTKTLKK